MSNFSAHIKINAPKEQVWAVIGGIWEGQFDSLAEHLDQLQRNQSQELD